MCHTANQFGNGTLAILCSEGVRISCDCHEELAIPTQFFDLGFEFGNRLLKIEKSFFRQNFLLGRSGAGAQYSTGKGSSERQIYQVATLQYGAHAAATSRASLRLTASPEK